MLTLSEALSAGCHAKTRTGVLIALVLFGPACDCDDRSEQRGQNGELIFSYVSADPDETFDRPLAQGAQLIMRVQGSDEERVTRVSALRATPSTTLGLEAMGADTFMVRGLNQGRATISLDAQVNQEKTPRQDSISIEVAKTTRQRIEHLCTTQREAAYLPGRVLEFGFERWNGGRKLVGQGGCEVGSQPALVEGVSCDERRLKVQGIAQTGPVKITDYAGTNTVTAHIVSPDLVDFAPVEQTLTVGRSESISLEAITQYWPVCASMTLNFDILTPETCTASGQVTSFSVEHEPGQSDMTLRGQASGDCIFRVSSPTLSRPESWEFLIPVYED